jgi:hypothetical protein
MDQRGELHNWKAKYGGLEVSEAKRKGRESENAVRKARHGFDPSFP